MARNAFNTLVDLRTFDSLRHRNYRLLWTGTLISHSGDWMDQLALNWLILDLTGSPFYLGLVNLFRAIPILLFTLVGGVIADRVERRKLLLVTQSISMLLAFLLATLVRTERIEIWHIMVLAALRGLTMSFNLPARQTIISDLVPRHLLANAVALNSMTMNLTKIIGPSLAGVLIVMIGTDGCFYINGVSFLAVLWTLHAMQMPAKERRPSDGGLRQSLGDGLRHIRRERKLTLLVTIALVPVFFGMPYQTMLAVFARDVLAVGSMGLGVLTSAAALGAVIGALAMASLESAAPRGKIMLLGMIAFGALLVVFSYSTWAPLSALLLVAVGTVQMSYNASNQTLMQMSVTDEYRGRVMSTLFVNRGLIPLGTAVAGTLATIIGVQLTVASMASVIVLLGLVLAVSSPTLRGLR